jgi:polygalacturonase
MWVISLSTPHRQALSTPSTTYDFEVDFGAPTDGTSDASTALQTAVNTITPRAAASC